MILVTVGAQMPFDRLVKAVDSWSGRNPDADVFAQIGDAAYTPSHCRWVRYLKPAEFDTKVSEARLVVAHAGMGSIITALQRGIPILVMPRRGDLLETRNDHQVATARQFLAQGRIHVAFDESELARKLDDIGHLPPSARVADRAAPELLARIRSFILARE